MLKNIPIFKKDFSHASSFSLQSRDPMQERVHEAVRAVRDVAWAHPVMAAAAGTGILAAALYSYNRVCRRIV